jgi:predicted methyltransferase
MKTEDVDKIVQTINDSVPVYEDVKKDLEDGKISFIEAGTLVVKHGGKALRLIAAAKEIGQEVADLTGDEAEIVINTIAEAYGQGNSKAFEGAKHLVKGLAEIRTGMEILLKKEPAEEEEV